MWPIFHGRLSPTSSLRLRQLSILFRLLAFDDITDDRIVLRAAMPIEECLQPDSGRRTRAPPARPQ
jgi:hypothetical protein